MTQRLQRGQVEHDDCHWPLDLPGKNHHHLCNPDLSTPPRGTKLLREAETGGWEEGGRCGVSKLAEDIIRCILKASTSTALFMMDVFAKS